MTAPVRRSLAPGALEGGALVRPCAPDPTALRRLVLPSQRAAFEARGWRATGDLHTIESLAQTMYVMVRDTPEETAP